MTEPDYAIIRSVTAGVIVEWGGAAESFFGYSAAEAVGQSLDLGGPEAYRERHWQGFNRAISEGVCRLDRATTNVPVQRKDGTIRPFPGRFVFLQDARNEVVGVIGLYAKPEGTEEAFGPIIPLDA